MADIQVHTKDGIEDLTWAEAKTKYGIDRPVTMANRVNDIINKLLEKGVITTTEANDLKKKVV